MPTPGCKHILDEVAKTGFFSIEVDEWTPHEVASDPNGTTKLWAKSKKGAQQANISRGPYITLLRGMVTGVTQECDGILFHFSYGLKDDEVPELKVPRR